MTTVDIRRQRIARRWTVTVAVLVLLGVGMRVDFSIVWDTAGRAGLWVWPALAASLLLTLVPPALLLRATVPELPMAAHLLMGPVDALITATVPGGPAVSLVVRHRMLTALGLRTARAGGATTLVAVTGGGLALVAAGVGATVLGANGHLPPQWPVGVAFATLGISVLLALFQMLRTIVARSPQGWVAREWRSVRTATRAAGVRRGPHVLAGQLLLLVAQLFALLLFLSAVQAGQHTMTVGQAVEVGAVFVLAHLLSWVPLVPLYAVDLALVLGLTKVGMAQDAAATSVLLWRTATLTALVAVTGLALLLWRTPAPSRGEPQVRPTETALGRLAHRGLFALVAVLPVPWRDRLRRAVFQRTFSFEDPWRYDEMPYELHKAEALVNAVPEEPSVIVELGCAQGHLTAKLAAAFPGARVVGVDLSKAALDSARLRTRALGNCEFVLADAVGLGRCWGQRPLADLLVVSEMLYYLGGARHVAETMAKVAPVLAPGARIVLLHPSSDAPVLHPAALGALGSGEVVHHQYDAPERPYTITTARRVPGSF